MHSILRSAALLGITVSALAMTPVATKAQAPQPDFPGAHQRESQPHFEPAIKPLGAAPLADLPSLVTPDEALSGNTQALSAEGNPNTSPSTLKRDAPPR